MRYESPFGPLGEAYVLVEVFSADGKRSVPLRAKVDTGAFASMLSSRFIADLGLTAIADAVLDTTAGPMPSHTYLARVKAPPLSDGPTLIVAGHPGKEMMLLGRTWLKAFVLTYDGPARTFSIVSPTPAAPRGSA